jgi:uncharacterized protein (UPF0335 family)
VSFETRLAILETKVEEITRNAEDRGFDIKEIKLHLTQQDKVFNRLMGAVMLISALSPILAKILFK